MEARELGFIGSMESKERPLGVVWIRSRSHVLPFGLEKILRSEAHVHRGPEPPAKDGISSVVLCPNGEDIAHEMKRLKDLAYDAPVLVFGARPDLRIARFALRHGARGFIHARMRPEHIVRALLIAQDGEIVLPRDLLETLATEESYPDPKTLRPRQKEILELVAEGLTNAQISRRLFVSESTVKQHLGAAFKVLGVRNRRDATRLWRWLHDPNEPSGGGASI